MKLLTKEIRQKLPDLRAQESLGSKAIAYVKFFTPDAGWTFWATYAELGISGLMWSFGLCRGIPRLP